jgi:amino acid adenylation domain-containing protein
MQQGILFHTLYASEPGVYCVQWSCTLHGNLHVPAFKCAWQHVMGRHPVLRTVFSWELRDEPFQIVYRHVDLPWSQHDWRGRSEGEQKRQFEAFLGEDRAQGFALSQAPLMRLTLIQLAEDAYQCVWSLHHILLDGWSLPLLLQEVFQIYDILRAGQELRLEVRRPYGDYIAWLQQQELSKAEAFWRQTLKGFTAPTMLHVDQGQGGFSSEAGYAAQQMWLSTAATAALRKLGQQHHLSLNTLVQGAWSMLLSRYSGQEDVVFGVTVSGRPTAVAGIESMIGLFINTLPVRVGVVPEALLPSWLHALQTQQVEARQYEYSPLVQIQGWSDVPRGLPLFESLLVFENYPARTAIQAWSGSLQICHVRFVSSTHYPLTVVAVPGRELRLRIEYQCHRFDAATITRMLGHLRTLLEGMATNPTQRLADFPMLTPAERHQLLVECNNTSTAYPQDTCIHQLFEAQVVRTPEAVAAIFEAQELTYRELNARANQLAHGLRALGVGPEVLVGIYVERSFEMVVGLLGILKAGGAYVPLDPTYPQERLAFMLADAEVRVLLTQKELILNLPRNEAHVLCLDADGQPFEQESKENVHSGVTADNLAYVIYTSGSTGQPKGVMIEQKSLVNYLCWFNHTVLGKTSPSIPLVTNLVFDASLKQLFAPLLRGKPVWILPRQVVSHPVALLQALQTRSTVMLNCVPSLWEAVLDTIDSGQAESPGKSLTRLLLGGERVTMDLIHRTLTVLPHLQIWNLYGPTEATANASAARIVSGNDTTIGCPIANTQMYILDSHLQPVPLGLSGELHIGGAGLARGYLNQPTLTAERFIPNPFSNKPGTRLYKTGDLARYLPDGTIEFLGRLDNQVKLRGYRIELGEIETILEQHPAIRQAVVVVRGDTFSDRRLVAYCVPHHGSLPDIHAWRRFLQTQLPDYMVPAAFVVLEALPLAPNGKVDRQALPAPDPAQSLLFEASVAPSTPVEELLAGIWASVLRIEAVGMHDNFFALGGHSLLAMQVISRLRKVLQVDMPLRALFEAPTVAGLARYIEGIRQTAQSTLAPPLQATSWEEVPLTMTQEHLWDLDRLLPGAPFSNMPYAARLIGPLKLPALEQSFNEIIKRHGALRTTFTTIAEQPVQVIASTLYLPLLMEDLHALPQAERDATAQRLIRTEVLYPFDLENGPLLRVRLLRLDEQEHILLLTMHHIISDGWSWGVLLQELVVLYEAFSQGRPSPLPALPMQYADYAHWQRQWLHSEAGKAQLAYWTQQLHAPLQLLDLPTDRLRTAELNLRTARQSFQFPKELTRAITHLSQQEGVTVFMTLVAAFKTLLYGYTGQEDIRVGTLVANRHHQDTEGLIGLFANVTILRTNLGGNPSLRQVLQRVRTTTLDTYAHQDLPFEYLARALERACQLDRQSLFQVMFAMQNARQGTLTLPALTIQMLETQPVEASACDLAVSIRESSQGLDGLCVYKTVLFDATTITRMLEDYQQTLEHLIARPELRLSSLCAQWYGKDE